MNEISGRCFFYINKYPCCPFMSRLTQSFSSNSYNNVPPTIMELMKDLKSFSDVVVKNVLLIGRIESSVLRTPCTCWAVIWRACCRFF